MKTNRFNYPNNFGFSSSIGRLIQDAFEGLEDLGDLFTNPTQTMNAPQADLFEDDTHYHVTLELPGVAKSDVKVELIGEHVKISATVSKETSEGRKNFPIKRAVPLPDKIGDGDINAKLEDGILTVSLPKAEAIKPRSINVE